MMVTLITTALFVSLCILATPLPSCAKNTTLGLGMNWHPVFGKYVLPNRPFAMWAIGNVTGGILSRLDGSGNFPTFNMTVDTSNGSVQELVPSLAVAFCGGDGDVQDNGSCTGSAVNLTVTLSVSSDQKTATGSYGSYDFAQIECSGGGNTEPCVYEQPKENKYSPTNVTLPGKGVDFVQVSEGNKKPMKLATWALTTAAALTWVMQHS